MNSGPECHFDPRRLAFLLRFAWAAAVACGGIAIQAALPPALEPAAVPQPTTWAWRQLIQHQVEAHVAPTVPAANHVPDVSPILLRAAPDTEVITMAPFHVNGDRVVNELHRTFAQQAKQAEQDLVMRRLGIGMHTVGYKHFGAGVVTAFYVPIFGRFGFTW